MNAPKEHQRILTIIKKVLEHVVRLLLEQSMADAGHTAFCLQGLSWPIPAQQTAANERALLRDVEKIGSSGGFKCWALASCFLQSRQRDQEKQSNTLVQRCFPQMLPRLKLPDEDSFRLAMAPLFML